MAKLTSMIYHTIPILFFASLISFTGSQILVSLYMCLIVSSITSVLLCFLMMVSNITSSIVPLHCKNIYVHGRDWPFL